MFIFNDKYPIVRGVRPLISCATTRHQDPDLLIKPGAENAKAVHRALAKFGTPLAGLKPEDFPEPIMVDILPDIKGIDFNRAW